MEQREYENAVMQALLAGDDPVLETLRQQYAACSIAEREFSGVGFFTTFVVPESIPRTQPPNFEIGDVYIDLEDREHGADVVLFVRGGAIDVLEGYVLDSEEGAWPDEPQVSSILYHQRSEGRGIQIATSEERDHERLRQSWRAL